MCVLIENECQTANKQADPFPSFRVSVYAFTFCQATDQATMQASDPSSKAAKEQSNKAAKQQSNKATKQQSNKATKQQSKATKHCNINVFLKKIFENHYNINVFEYKSNENLEGGWDVPTPIQPLCKTLLLV